MGQLRGRMESDLLLKRLSKGTCRHYLGAAHRFAMHFECSPAQLGEAEVREYLHHLVLVEGASVSAQKMALAGIRFLYTVTLGRPEVVANIPWPKVAYKLPEVLARSEVAALLARASTPLLRTAFVVAYGSGLRVSEVCRLEAQDIDSARGVIRVRAGKGQKDRQTLLVPTVLDALRSWWPMRPMKHPAFVFPGTTSAGHISPHPLQDGFRKAANQAEITRTVTFHSLRHAFATHLLESGVDLRVIQVLLGHSQIRTTTRYTAVTAEHLQRIPDPFGLLPTP